MRFGKCADISVMQDKIVNTLKNKNWKAEFVRAVNAHIVDEKIRIFRLVLICIKHIQEIQKPNRI